MAKLALVNSSTSPQSKVVTMPNKTAEILPPKPSPLPMAGSKNFAAILRKNTTYLRGLLPPDSASLYTPRRYGNRLGIPIVCPHCDDRPPHWIRGYGRWRWMTFHIATRHTH